MIILVALVLPVLCCAATALLWHVARTHHARASIPPTCVPAESSGSVPSSTDKDDGLTWSALDDLQLTRLLNESARGTNTE